MDARHCEERNGSGPKWPAPMASSATKQSSQMPRTRESSQHDKRWIASLALVMTSRCRGMFPPFASTVSVILRCEPTGPARSGRPDDKLREPRRTTAEHLGRHPSRAASGTHRASAMDVPSHGQATLRLVITGPCRSQNGVVSLAYAGGPCRRSARTRAGGKHCASVTSAWIAGSKSGNDQGKDERERKARKRNADRRKALMPCHYGHGRASVKREVHICRRSTAALARGTLVPKAQRQARLPGTWQDRLVLNARPNRGAKTLRRCLRALPALTCPSPARHLPPQS